MNFSEQNNFKVTVIALGYVGLPFAIEIANKSLNLHSDFKNEKKGI